MATSRPSERSDATYSPAEVPDPPMAGRADYSQFIWQKLNDLDSRFVDFSDKYGRIDERLIAIDKRLEKVESKLSDVHSEVRTAKAWIVGAIFVVGALAALYKLLESHISLSWK